jgi:hypothetical protein
MATATKVQWWPGPYSEPREVLVAALARAEGR